MVRSDDERIMLCALDYDSPETVTVNDLVYTRTTDGWQLHKSSYPKLRIAPDTLAKRVEAAGLAVTHHAPEPNGMWTTVASAVCRVCPINGVSGGSVSRFQRPASGR